MLEWLTSPIDPTRVHEIGTVTAWHARLMVVAWGGMFPLGILIARFFKIWPKQNWPQRLDHKGWWHSHLALQGVGAALALLGFVLIWWFAPDLTGQTHWHRWFGLLSMILLVAQVLGGLLRGTKGGPTDPGADGSWRGDHYDMTRRRVWFEYSHKCLGYLALACAAIAILSGMWQVNAAKWMWLGLALWWTALCATAFVLQRAGHTVDTYQAIWGADKMHPGNSQKPIGFGIHRSDTHGIEKT